MDTNFNEKSVDGVTNNTDSHYCSSMPYHVNPQQMHSYNNSSSNNKKIGRIFYEIGSFLGIVGLGKDYKKEVVGDAKPPIYNKIRKSSSPNTLQRSKVSFDAEAKNSNSRDQTPPLSRVNKTYPYRLKSSTSSSKNKLNNKPPLNNDQSTSDHHSGSSSLQSSPKLLQNSKIPIQSNPNCRKMSFGSSIPTAKTHHQQKVDTDDSGIYGDSRRVVIEDEALHQKGNPTRPGSLNIKLELEKSNVFQKRKDLLTSSNSTEDDENVANSFSNDSVISQLVNASNVMRDQMRILIDNGSADQQKQRFSVPRSNSKSSTSSNQQATPSDDYVFVNYEAHNRSQVKITRQIQKQQQQQITPKSCNNDDDENLQSTVL